ncbi:N-acetylglucosaminyldiphosphoundecaprenol N-acetyl-beta-D-mannosaminyltransferase [Tistlia consotensis]|uniref:N-acetylglucosaminyldiphosphoundecaprenol N-acetyl-beta-D-mannosaminyltransferase n=1 Tax=Tistlia consotensis USBA 355 TaxID=560819 RepID=A0A1Y6BTU1_9PROT|nr:WecB/TagA/CpsF family glycosyltransferase [Tistlia consotensis]SMF21025.1 N-acetylglucosaminyldiphosphoundecaprenol N-acetyl-beta-D-mannosaminyltransferase [Tistlia consotensis USBA 355]SNR47266.1 N-acetylglucosaminyldiphosphoundecaprenol N-acetyl-beta-D-mannosaminyltransferase [Tistlia consotensis]
MAVSGGDRAGERRAAAWPRENVLGVGVSALNLDRACASVERWIAEGERHYVCVTGVHGVMESRRDPALRRIHNAAGLVTPDGMPLVWMLKLGRHAGVDRVYGPDLMLELFRRSEQKGFRHFLYGSTPEVLARLQARLAERFPAAEVVGSFSPPFRPLSEAESAAIVERINASGADILWVGLSTPKQERWMAEHRARLAPAALIGVGAAFDFHAGLLRQAPRFVQRSGFEWLFRTAMEPRRLWKRYARNVPLFLLAVAAQKSGLRRYPLDE